MSFVREYPAPRRRRAPRTPLSIVALGLSAWLGWLDYVLLPALAFFVALTVYAVWRRQRRQTTRTDG